MKCLKVFVSKSEECCLNFCLFRQYFNGALNPKLTLGFSNHFQELINDAETRYMDLVCFENEPELVLDIVLACSDAVLRKFRFDMSKDRLQLLSESHPPESHAFLRVQKCFDQISFDQIQADFVTSSTNGKVIFWNFENMSKIREVRVHKSGINSMMWLEKGTLVTGGDDGAMGCVSFPDLLKELKVIKHFVNKKQEDS